MFLENNFKESDKKVSNYRRTLKFNVSEEFGDLVQYLEEQLKYFFEWLGKIKKKIFNPDFNNFFNDFVIFNELIEEKLSMMKELYGNQKEKAKQLNEKIIEKRAELEKQE